MNRSSQLSLFPTALAHGGDLSVGRRKGPRPLCTRRPLHVVMRAERARGELSLLTRRNSGIVKNLLAKWTSRCSVRVYEFANSGNHLHLLLLAKSRDDIQTFLRAFCGVVALKVTRAGKGKGLGKRFWDLLVYTRVAEWGKAFEAVRRYVVRNRVGHCVGFPYALSSQKTPQGQSARALSRGPGT